MSAVQQPQSPGCPPTPRPARSKNGCNTCRRRKVRCNEQRPRCSHCERLNLDCTWGRASIRRTASVASSSNHVSASQMVQTHPNHQPFTNSFGITPFSTFFTSPVTTWDDSMLVQGDGWADFEIDAPLPPDLLPQSMGGTWHSPTFNTGFINQSTRLVTAAHDAGPAATSASPLSTEGNLSSVDNEYLINTFLQMLMPPILAPVEIGPKWASTRSFFASMASDSSMVRLAIMAFSAYQLQKAQSGLQTDYRILYNQASRELHEVLGAGTQTSAIQKDLKYTLASIFLLTYTDLLTENIPQAHVNLKEAYHLIQKAGKDSFTAGERRLISWIRLLDAKAVSTAGGEGLFLTEGDDTVFASSPAPAQATGSEALDTEVEEVLFDVLYHPGIVFYQKVQSFVGRITKIDPWHRSRGTVQDETEVMATAAQISNDLHALYRQRPALMDHAVAGNLTEKHLARNLAQATTRSFRTYLANYYACFLHLHRVAYKQYPRTKDVTNAMAAIKRLAHLLDDADEALPVNLLWPLLMWGCEEESHDDRLWILSTIRRLENNASNAKATADVLEEVQRRQDETKMRVDVRAVSQDFHASHFAII